MEKRGLVFLCFLIVFSVSSHFRVQACDDRCKQEVIASSPFSTALEILQKQMNYTFDSIGLLRRAMTHASFSEENNRALSILGTYVIETSVSLRYLTADIDMPAKTLDTKVSDISNVENSCSGDGMRLGLHKVIRVSSKTNASTPTVICGGFRAIFGAIAIDAGKSDFAGNIFWSVHSANGGVAAAL
ncbi:hypothetical protein Nepgr_018642 [Nepenthes gracilis]|uniref:RNase III domain-containing protein n=1 Tax=Nepenthes gracilis TaxID=150966 RepID=A0AAD3XUI5_NEPGR|nr:hypothetical protein Nepgr_018642 [Nepenthes gracilis]